MDSDSAGPQGRTRWVKRLAWALAGISSLVLFGIVDLMTLPGWTNPAYEWQVPLDASWGSLFTFLLAGAYVWTALRPVGSWAAIVQIAIVGSAISLSSLLGGDGRALLVGIPVLGTAALLAWLARDVAGSLPRTTAVSWPLAVLAVAGLPLWFGYTAFAAERSWNAAEDTSESVNTLGLDHWPFQVAVGLALGACAIVMAVWPPGRPLMRLSVSISAAYIGVAMLAFPDRSGAMPGYLWGVSMVLWGTLVALPLPLGSRLGEEASGGRGPGKQESPGPKTGAFRGARRGT